MNPAMTLVFDIGMFDGADTAAYLAQGCRVVAVEANPALVTAAAERFALAIQRGQLTVCHAAISADGAPVTLTLSGADLGSSSTIVTDAWRAAKRPVGEVTVPGTTLAQLVAAHGVPHYLKVDIEGADRHVVLALTAAQRPPYLSFEVGDDADELIAHAAAVGYRRFKIVNQLAFRELANQDALRDRLARRLMRTLGLDEPRLVRRAGHWFVVGHSSGPVPWQGDGRWWSAQQVRTRLADAHAQGALRAWYDIHAAD
jgi:FkbM family methyltransferase